MPGLGSGSSFRVTFWDPWLIISQILCIQSTVYFFWSLIIYFASFMSENSPSLSQVLTSKQYTFEYISGWTFIFLYFLCTTLVGAASIAITVGKLRQCLDFGCTFFFLHLLLCSFYHKIPDNFLWWACTFINLTCMVLLAEYLCMRIELMPISIGGSTSISTRGRSRHSGADEEIGLIRMTNLDGTADSSTQDNSGSTSNPRPDSALKRLAAMSLK
ncbi:hypothetical protein MP638_004310 [Amoeboaphelidium occidentale]|nr:hypothetical protein MP638_004310 [Amoeboaphelidium occidentale]